MAQQVGPDPSEVYDRQLVLLGARRDAVLELWEVHRYGTDSFGDPDHVSVFGMAPSYWYARGVRILGRTAVECTRDALADAIAVDVAARAESAPARDGVLVIDLFAGSGNTLYWIVRRLPAARGLGFELDRLVYELTSRNLAVVGADITVANTDYAVGLTDLTVGTGELVVVFVAPPWGAALDPVAGLDLRLTEPPVADVVQALLQRFPDNCLLVVIQVYEVIDPSSLAELELLFDWVQLHLYHLGPAGSNHGVLLGTRGWTPDMAVRSGQM